MDLSRKMHVQRWFGKILVACGGQKGGLTVLGLKSWFCMMSAKSDLCLSEHHSVRVAARRAAEAARWPNRNGGRSNNGGDGGHKSGDDGAGNGSETLQWRRGHRAAACH